MKTLTRLIAVALCLAMFCAVLPQMTLTAHAEELSGECGPNLTWTLDTETGVLTIEGTGPMDQRVYDYSVDDFRPYVKSVVLPEGLTTLADSAFYGCDALTDVELPESLTEIGGYAFFECIALSEVNIPANVTKIGEAAFGCCHSLKEMNVAADNTAYCGVDGVLFDKEMTILVEYPAGKEGAYAIPEGVTVVEDGAFDGCKALREISFPASVRAIGWGGFEGCTGLTEITFPEGLEYIDCYAFDGCANLTDVSLPDSLFVMGMYAFSSCGLTSISIPDNLEYVPTNAFAYCANLREVTLPENMRYIGTYAFAECTSLTEIVLSDGLLEIDAHAFDNASALAKVTIPASVNNIQGGAFSNCPSLREIEVSPDNETYFIQDGVLCDKNGTLIQYPAGKADTAYTTPETIKKIASAAFQGCNLRSVTISDSVKTIGDRAFLDCAALEELNLGKGLSKVKELAFADCPSLTSVLIPANVKKIEANAFGCFYNCIGYYSPSSRFIIYGNVNSAAQTYAKDEGITFYPVDRFVDVKEDDSCFIPVMWAVSRGITAGTDDTHFSPDKTVTRAESMVFFWAAEGRPDYTETDKTFRDVKKKHWAYPAVMWAVENGITAGTDENHFSPDKTCTRCEILQFFYAAEEAPACAASNPYADVKDKHWYKDSAVWAYENGIELGENGMFNAKTPCTRAAVVIYLYNYFNRMIDTK